MQLSPLLLFSFSPLLFHYENHKTHSRTHGLHLRRARDDLRDRRLAPARAVYRDFDLRLDEFDRRYLSGFKFRILARRKNCGQKARHKNLSVGYFSRGRRGRRDDLFQGRDSFVYRHQPADARIKICSRRASFVRSGERSARFRHALRR